VRPEAPADDTAIKPELRIVKKPDGSPERIAHEVGLLVAVQMPTVCPAVAGRPRLKEAEVTAGG
jgi:hypothetical protein